MAEKTNSTLATFLADHPRMMGALFTLLVLLTKSSTVMADGCSTGCTGP